MNKFEILKNHIAQVLVPLDKDCYSRDLEVMECFKEVIGTMELMQKEIDELKAENTIIKKGEWIWDLQVPKENFTTYEDIAKSFLDEARKSFNR